MSSAWDANRPPAPPSAEGPPPHGTATQTPSSQLREFTSYLVQGPRGELARPAPVVGTSGDVAPYPTSPWGWVVAPRGPPTSVAHLIGHRPPSPLPTMVPVDEEILDIIETWPHPPQAYILIYSLHCNVRYGTGITPFSPPQMRSSPPMRSGTSVQAELSLTPW